MNHSTQMQMFDKHMEESTTKARITTTDEEEKNEVQQAHFTSLTCLFRLAQFSPWQFGRVFVHLSRQ